MGRGHGQTAEEATPDNPHGKASCPWGLADVCWPHAADGPGPPGRPQPCEGFLLDRGLC